MEKNFKVEMLEGEDTIMIELAEMAYRKEIPEWGSYDLERQERIYPLTIDYLNLYDDDNMMGEIVANVEIRKIAGEKFAKLTITWED